MTKTDSQHKFAVIGLGLRMATVLRAANDIGWNYKIAGIADPAPVGLPLLAERGIEPGQQFDTVDELLAAGPYDLILIGSPNHLHRDHLVGALDTGYPTFVEKPIVRTQDETLDVARRLASRPRDDLYVGLVARSAPLIREAVARLDSKTIGEIISIDATEHLPAAHGSYLARNWRRRQDWVGSYLLDKVCHDFDILGRVLQSRVSAVASFGGRSIFGTGEAATAPASDAHSAFLSRFAGWSAAQDSSGRDMDVNDHQVAIAAYANGTKLSFHSNTKVMIPQRHWYIAGTKGTMLVDFVRMALTVKADDGRGIMERIEFEGRPGDPHNGADQAMAIDLRAAVEGRAPFPVNPYESMEAGLTVMAIDQAMQERQVVDCTAMWRAFDQACGRA